MRRWQPPVHSPLSGRALLRGLTAALGAREGAQREVEVRLRARYAPRRLLLTDSGTTALTLALSAVAAREPDRPIAIPAYCCYDVATAVVGAGVTAILYDVDPSTLSPDEKSLRAALRAGASAVVIAHLYGVPVDLAMMRPLLEETGAILIDDAAQGAGAEHGDRPLGTTGSLGVLSFGRGKGITGGGGGALLANDDVGEQLLASTRPTLSPGAPGWRGLAVTTAQWVLGHPRVYGIPASLPFLRLGDTVYRSPRPAAEPTGSMAGILSVTLDAAERGAEVRRGNARQLMAAIDEHGPVRPIRVPPGTVPGYLRLPLVLSPDACRHADTPEARRLGIMPGYPTELGALPELWERCHNPRAEHTGARLLARRLYTLPTHSFLSPHDLERLEHWLEGAARADVGAVPVRTVPRHPCSGRG